MIDFYLIITTYQREKNVQGGDFGDTRCLSSLKKIYSMFQGETFEGLNFRPNIRG